MRALAVTGGVAAVLLLTLPRPVVLLLCGSGLVFAWAVLVSVLVGRSARRIGGQR